VLRSTSSLGWLVGLLPSAGFEPQTAPPDGRPRPSLGPVAHTSALRQIVLIRLDPPVSQLGSVHHIFRGKYSNSTECVEDNGSAVEYPLYGVF
jgi:hypothetical protein